MATYTTYAQYYIYFRDQTQYNAAIAAYGAAFIGAAPRLMGTLLGISNYGNTFGDKGIVSVEYELTGVGSEIKNPAGSGLFLDPTVPFMLVPAQQGGADDMIIRWAGIIVKAPSNATPTDLTRKRRWGGGQEIAPIGEGGIGLNPNRSLCRDASRFCDGLGWAFRNETGVTLTHSLTEYGAASVPTQSWERIYLRIRTAPSGATAIWRSNGTISASAGARLVVNANRTLTVENVNSVNAVTVTTNGTTVLNLNQWYRLDMILGYAPSPLFRLYIGAALELAFTATAGNGGLGQAQSHLQSLLGDVNGGGTNLLEIDFDEWENAEPPDLTSLDSIDWLNGIRYKKAWVVGGTITNWVPNEVQSMNMMVSPLGSSSTADYTSSTALARLDGLTDVSQKDVIDDLTGFSLGVIAAVIGIYSSRVGGDGQLGYRLVGGAPVLATILQAAGTQFNSVMYRPAGVLAALAEVSPFSVVHDKGNTATASLVLGVQAVLGYLGLFGNEDGQFIAGYSRRALIHNGSGANTLYANSGPFPNGNCASFGATYVGNGLSQDINLPFLPHMIWIRNTATVAGANGPVNWFACGLGAHFGGNDKISPDYGIRVWIDSTGQCKITVCGADDEVNQNAVIYQLFAFCDPGMRFMVGGAWRHQTTLVSAVNPLQNGLFTPEAVLSQSDLSNTNSNVIMSCLKGPGNSANAGQRYDGTAQASLMTFGAGSITSLANTHIGASQYNYLAMRTNDGSAAKMIQILQYTGNGVASRVIPLTPTSGKAPIFVIVQPVNGSLHFRDPSHTGVNASRYDLAQITTAITAVGVDSITVGIALNANGVVHNIIAFCGDAAAMVNGTFYAPSILPPSDAWFGGVALLNVDDTSGIYVLTPGLTHDELWSRQGGVQEVDVKIPNPTFKTGYVGG